MQRKDNCSSDNSLTSMHTITENCEPKNVRWEPMVVEDLAEADCGFYSANVFFGGKFREITLTMSCLGRIPGKSSTYS